MKYETYVIDLIRNEIHNQHLCDNFSRTRILARHHYTRHISTLRQRCRQQSRSTSTSVSTALTWGRRSSGASYQSRETSFLLSSSLRYVQNSKSVDVCVNVCLSVCLSVCLFLLGSYSRVVRLHFHQIPTSDMYGTVSGCVCVSVCLSVCFFQGIIPEQGKFVSIKFEPLICMEQ